MNDTARAKLARDLLDAVEVGRILGVSPRQVQRLAELAEQAHRLQCVKRTTGGAYLFHRSDVERFATNRRGRGNPKLAG